MLMDAWVSPPSQRAGQSPDNHHLRIHLPSATAWVGPVSRDSDSPERRDWFLFGVRRRDFVRG